MIHDKPKLSYHLSFMMITQGYPCEMLDKIVHLMAAMFLSNRCSSMVVLLFYATRRELAMVLLAIFRGPRREFLQPYWNCSSSLSAAAL